MTPGDENENVKLTKMVASITIGACMLMEYLFSFNDDRMVVNIEVCLATIFAARHQSEIFKHLPNL